MSSVEVARVKRQADLYNDLKLKEQYSTASVTGREKIGEHEVYVQAVEFALGNAECLNELYPTMWRIERFKLWIVEKCQPHDVGIVVEADWTIRRNPSAVFAANSILVVVERRVTVGDEVEMVDSAIGALIGADAIEGVGTTEHVLNDCPPVFRLLPGINGVKSRVDRVPARGRSVLTSIATFVFSDVHLRHTNHYPRIGAIRPLASVHSV